jgi:hypothetical protein
MNVVKALVLSDSRTALRKIGKSMNIHRIRSKFRLKIHAREFFTKFSAQLLISEKKKEAGEEFASTSKKVKGEVQEIYYDRRRH